MTKFYEYSGMNYESASREAGRLLAGGWFKNFERLEALREIMMREERQTRRPIVVTPEKQAEIQALDPTLSPTERLRKAVEIARRPDEVAQ